MSDGSSLRQSWYTALNDAETHFRTLLTSPSTEWKRLSTSVDSTSTAPKQKQKLYPRISNASSSSLPELGDVIVHRNSVQGGSDGDVYRVVLDVPTGDEVVGLDPWKAVLTTPELRKEWDPSVEEAHLVEMFDRNTRIAKTNYTLGWPANPRDAVTISRSFSDATTLIDISTSLPRSPDEPAYLRPSPPYVRSHVKLFAWCIQHTPPSSKATQGRLRLTCFVQHDLKALWGFGYSTAALSLQLSTMSLSFLKSVIKRGSRVAQLTGWGHGVSIERVRYQIDREALTVDYVILPEEEDHGEAGGTINEVREQRRLTRSVECVVPFGGAGWDVQVTMKASDEEVERLPWSAHAIRVVNNSSEPTSSTSSSPNSTSTFANTTMVVTTSPLATPTQILLRLTHSALPSQDCVLKVKLVIEVSGGTRGLRLNGLAKPIIDVEERDPSSMVLEKGEEGRRMLQDVASAVDWSFRTGEESWATVDSGSTGFSGGVAGAGAGDRSSAFLPPGQVSAQGAAQAMVVVGSGRQERTAAADKSILSKVRRNYIYFSSLLQEPEAKWRRTTESRGVSITQLDSIDPTLVVYRAEATFVGVGLWDLYGAVVSPGARVYWDKQHEDGVLLEDVNELTELWWFKRGGSWPVNGRDSVVLKTVYKSPTTIHVFSFSASPSDTHLFPSIPPPPPSVIRTQTDLQGWAIESLSPNTTLLTLLEQSDPKGWSGKASIPTQMVGTLAGIGEFAIKQGGTPVVTRMKGGRKREVRYEHERGVFRVEYEPDSRRGRKTSTGGKEEEEEEDSGAPAIECEIRCDVDTWASSLDIVVDPPPQGITCLRRHRLSPEGGGLWITFTHDAIFVDDPRLLVIVRRGPGSSSSAGVAGAGASTQGGLGMQKEFSQRGERGMSIPLVNVNGQRVQVDVEEMGEGEVREMMKRKRVKPVRVPLDQPPVLGVVRRRRAELATGGSGGADGDATSKEKGDTSGTEKDAKDKEAAAGGWASAPRISSPLSRFFTYAVDQATTTTQQAVAAISPSGSFGSVGVAELDPTKMPMQYALEALAWTQEYICTKSHAAYLQASSSFPASSSTTSVSSIGPPPPLQAQDDGWTLVADKGMLIQRKLVPEISPTIPVHRGSKVIQGFSAEEILGVITETECRKTWDDRFDAAGSRVLEAFGAGAGTAWVVGKAGFPWRDRGFWVAGVVGRVGTGAGGNLGAQPSLSRRNTDDSSDPSSSSSSSSPSSYPSSSSGTRNAVVYVSASFSPSSPSSLAFSPAKLNPYALPIGRVYIDAWVLETLDPYTKENYAIPSTRCTRLVAVDYKGSLPAAVNGMINAGLVRGVLGVEAYLKGGVSPTGTTPAFNGVSPAAMPMTRLPAAGLVFSERKDLHNHLHHLHHAAVASGALAPMVGSAPFMAWKLRKRDESRVLVETRFDVERRVYRAVVLVRMGGPGAGGTTTTTPVGGTARIEDVKEGNVIAGDGDIDVDVDTEETTPRPSTLSLNPQTRPQHAHTHSHSHSYSHSTSPTKRSRNPFEDALDSSTSDATLPLTSPRPNASTPLLPMPGSMIVSPTFPAGSGSRSPPPINTNTKRSPSAPGIRQRAASSGAGSLHSVGLGLGSGLGVGIGGGMGMGAGMNAHVRGRTTSSVFTVKGEVKVPLDLVVMEVVVDSKMYAHPGDGAGEGGGEAEVGYCVDVKARRRTGGDAIPLSIPSSPPSPTPPTSSEPEPDPDTPPFLYTLHTLPSSPLHSSGLSSSADGTPTRHLLRVTLPTAQYKVSTVRDPLTGEVRKGPERPGWMGGDWVVEVVVRPLEVGVGGVGVGLGAGVGVEGGSGGKGTGKKGAVGGKKKGGKGKVVMVMVGGREVEVVGEREGLTSVGREELLDDRVGRMGVLSRIPNESEPLPEELNVPIGIASDLLHPPPVLTTSASAVVQAEGEGSKSKSKSQEDGEKSEDTPGTPKTEMTPGGLGVGGEAPHVGHVASSSGGGILGFWASYPNPLARFTGGAVKGTSGGGGASANGLGSGTLTGGLDGPETKAETSAAISGNGTNGTELGGAPATSATSGSVTQVLRRHDEAQRQLRYSLSTVVFVALIAFLIGSLLRSLLSPADFIYVVTDASGSGQHAQEATGWREIRRLLEIKYLVGGWDFQVAVVRRHL